MHNEDNDLPGRLLSTRHAAEHLDVHAATLFRAAKCGELHPVSLGKRCVRWQLDELNAWTASRRRALRGAA